MSGNRVIHGTSKGHGVEEKSTPVRAEYEDDNYKKYSISLW
jgi:hypothetical protein